MFAMGRRVEASPIRVKWDAVRISLWALVLGWLAKTVVKIVWTVVRSPVAMSALTIAAVTLIGYDGAGLGPVLIGYGLALLGLVWLRWRHPAVFERWVWLAVWSRWRRFSLYRFRWPASMDTAGLNRIRGGVQYFAALEPQQRLTPHLHAAMRGVVSREVMRQVIEATYVQVWWPAHDQPVYVYRQPTWTGDGYCDPDTGQMLPTWAEALDQHEADPDAKPAHVMRFGSQYDMAGIIAPSPAADRTVRYLAKYLTKAVSDPR